jgi:branched-chain amino acid transport system substrate-binding protein
LIMIQTLCLQRRKLIIALAAMPMLAPQIARAQGSIIRLGQSIALSGPLGDLGKAIHEGAKVSFAAINASGGVGGRMIELVALDDAYDVKKAVANVDSFVADRSMFALFNCMGTPMIEAIMPKVIESGIPLFAPFTGAMSARPNARNVFNVRASYPDEARHLIKHLSALGVKSIAIAYQNNAFGKEILEAARAALGTGVTLAAEVAVANTGEDADVAAEKIIAAKPNAVLLGLAGKAAIEFVAKIRTKQNTLPLYALSVLGSAATIKAIGSNARGIAMSQVVPLPSGTDIPIVADFAKAWAVAQPSVEPSHLALEGYINARIFAELIRRAGRSLSRASFIDTALATTKAEVGGFRYGFAQPGQSASSYVELTMVRADGRFLR